MNHLFTLYLAIPQPPSTPPPGATQLTLIVSWGLWIATLACVAAVVKAGVQIALAGHGRGGGGEHGITLLLALAGAIVCGVAATAVTVLS
jgi:hypothetical protein